MKIRKVSSVFFAFLLMGTFFMLPVRAHAGDLSAGNNTIAIAPTRPDIDICGSFEGLKGNIFTNPVGKLLCNLITFLEKAIFTPVVMFSCLMVNSMLTTNFDPNIRSGYDIVKGTCRIYD